MKNTKIVFFLSFSLFVLSCKKDNGEVTPEFDKKDMLMNYGNQIIVPAYENLKVSVSRVETAMNDFISISNATNLQALRSQFLQSYLQWQGVSYMNFGPSENYTLKPICNTYPLDTTVVNSNISSGTYVLGSASNTTAIGFPALDFLLFPDTSLNTALSKINGSNSVNKKQYMLDLILQIKGGITSTLSSWQGSYLATFTNSDGNGNGSSLSEIINAINLDFEKFTRDGKIGIPLGVRSLGTPLPSKTEAFYSKHSLFLFKESIQQLKRYFNGTSSSDIGLDDYLNHLNDNNNVARLSVKINNQFDLIIEKADLITSPISIAVRTEQIKVQDLYDELQRMVVLLKVDMSSTLSVLITYQDNDGD